MHSKLKHHPVMVDEIISYLAPEKLKTYVDCTFGQGGYSKKILENSNVPNAIKYLFLKLLWLNKSILENVIDRCKHYGIKPIICTTISESDNSIEELSNLPFKYQKLPNTLRDLIKEEGIDRVNRLIKEGLNYDNEL